MNCVAQEGKNERKGEWNYRPGWRYKSCIWCFMARQKNSTPVDHRSYNCTWMRQDGSGRTVVVCVSPSMQLRVCTHTPSSRPCVSSSVLLGVTRGKDDKRKWRARLLFRSWVHPGWASHGPHGSLADPWFTSVITLFVYLFWFGGKTQSDSSDREYSARLWHFCCRFLIKRANRWIINHHLVRPLGLFEPGLLQSWHTCCSTFQ